MPIFEKFPLIDGTFFVSPRQHGKSAVSLITNLSNSSIAAQFASCPEKKYLNAICMGCLEGWNCNLRCRGCSRRWDGSHLILGSMYAYDIFAAIPCCMNRLKCNNCSQLVVPSNKKLEFFSEFSQAFSCSGCRTKDFHFVKPLPVTFIPGPGRRALVDEVRKREYALQKERNKNFNILYCITQEEEEEDFDTSSSSSSTSSS